MAAETDRARPDRDRAVRRAQERARELAEARYPRRDEAPAECDLVMKGGITSGVVYPLAACELARTYRFRNLGGSSAGAIAAAAVAAAEHGRDGGGFGRLATVPAEIGPTLPQLFTPAPPTETAHRTLMALLDRDLTPRRRLSAVWRVQVRARRRVFLGWTAAGVALAVVAALALTGVPAGPAGWARATVAAAFLALVAVAVATGAALWEELRAMWRSAPDLGFGICTGSAGADAGDPPPGAGGPGHLTDWLSTTLDRIAGVDEPLTFGQLEAVGVALRVMTTDLTHGRARAFPFATSAYLFDPVELGAYFPPAVVRVLQGDGTPAEHEGVVVTTPQGRPLLPLPPAERLPVVVAARLSLSFPGLIGAVPLWSVEGSDPAGQPIVARCWFSDGGITSNFPLHLFDSLWPRRPTFAIDLRESDHLHPDTDVHYAGTQPRPARTREITSPVDFVGAILDTMQYWSDESQAELPGFRDRIVELRLQPGEGGMNLAMDEATVAVLAEKGRQAAEAIVPHTGPDGQRAGFDFGGHRIRRFAASAAHLQAGARQLAALYGEPLPDGSPAYRDLITSPGDGVGWNVDEARSRSEELVAFGDDRPPDFAAFSPRPLGNLRITGQ